MYDINKVLKTSRFPVNRELAVIILFVISFIASGSEEGPDVLTQTLDWLPGNNIKSLYKTPLGTVYQFSYSPEFKSCKQDKDKKIFSLQADIANKQKKNRKTYRYTAIDFKIRVFPAVSSIENPVLNFTLTSSRQPAEEINYYRDIQAVMRFKKLLDAPKRSRMLPLWHSVNKLKYKRNAKTEQIATLGVGYTPNYHVVWIRYIHDSNGKGICYKNENDFHKIVVHKIRGCAQMRTRSFGIIIESPQFTSNREYITRPVLEVSSLTVKCFNDPEELLKLTPVKIIDYPYSGYSEEFERYRGRDNPDAVYAYAMKLLKGDNLELGFELLEKVASRKKHILAMYQLGICYWRGIGVKQDLNKALHWLKAAREFGLAEAYAMSGLIKMRNSAAPYIPQSTRNLVYLALNSYGPDFCTNPDWLASYIFYNHKASGNPVYFYDCSGKTRFWDAKNELMHEYYKDNVDRKYIEKVFESLDIIRTDKNKYYELRIPPHKGIYYEYDGMKQLDQMISEDFIPAIYYKGQLLLSGCFYYENRKKHEIKANASGASVLFAKGAKLGNLECGVEVLHCKARQGKLKPADFTTELDIKFADHPLYYMLKYIVSNPGTPGVKEFIGGNYAKAREIWRNNPSAQNNFLLGAEGLYQFMNVGFDTKLYRLYHQKTADLVEAFRRLDKAVDGGIMPAVYLSGMYYITGKRNSTSLLKGDYRDAGVVLLSKVAAKGFLKARYYLIKYQFEKGGHVQSKWLNELKPLRDVKDVDAWLLSADILARINRNSNKRKIIKAYEITGKLGNARAWDRLGWIYYKSGKHDPVLQQKASQAWKKFLDLDKETRKQDPLDPYWDKIRAPKRWRINKSGKPYPISILSVGIKEKDFLHYLKRYIDINNIK